MLLLSFGSEPGNCSGVAVALHSHGGNDAAGRRRAEEVELGSTSCIARTDISIFYVHGSPTKSALFYISFGKRTYMYECALLPMLYGGFTRK